MATGWAHDGAVQDQIDATIKDGIQRARSNLPKGPGRENCEECGVVIPKARRQAVPGVRLCVSCQEAHDREEKYSSAAVSRLPDTNNTHVWTAVPRLPAVGIGNKT